MRTLGRTNIARNTNSFEDDENLYAVIESSDGTDLDNLLKE